MASSDGIGAGVGHELREALLVCVRRRLILGAPVREDEDEMAGLFLLLDFSDERLLIGLELVVADERDPVGNERRDGRAPASEPWEAQSVEPRARLGLARVVEILAVVVGEGDEVEMLHRLRDGLWSERELQRVPFRDARPVAHRPFEVPHDERRTGQEPGNLFPRPGDSVLRHGRAHAAVEHHVAHEMDSDERFVRRLPFREIAEDVAGIVRVRRRGAHGKRAAVVGEVPGLFAADSVDGLENGEDAVRVDFQF